MPCSIQRSHRRPGTNKRKYSARSFVLTILIFFLLGVASLWASEARARAHGQGQTLYRRDVRPFEASDEEVFALQLLDSKQLMLIIHPIVSLSP